MPSFQSQTTTANCGGRTSEVRPPQPVLSALLILAIVFGNVFSNFALLLGPIPRAEAANYKLRQEVNIMDSFLYASANAYATSSEIVNINPVDYSSGTYYFEVVASTTSGTSATVYLVNSTSSAVMTSVTVNGGNTYQLYRSASFTPSATSTDYIIKLGNDNIGKGVLAGRIVILQDAATVATTTTQIEIGNNETYPTSPSTATTTFASPKYWHYNAANWDGSPTFYAEVTMQALVGVASSTAFTAAGTYNVTTPSGTASTTIELLGGGGAGGGASNANRPDGGSGGAGGQYAKSTFGGLGGTHVLVVAATAAGNANAAGTTGNESSWDSTTVVAKGGDPGQPGVDSTTVASTTGNTTGCVFNIVCYAGGGGGAGMASIYGGGGGAGAGTLGTGNSATAAAVNGATTTYAGLAGGTKDTVTNTAGHPAAAIVAYGGGGGGGAWHSSTNSAGTPAGGTGAKGLATTTNYVASTTISLQVSDGSGDGFQNWTTIVTIAAEPTATSTRVRSPAFTPNDGKNYRIAFNVKDSRVIMAIYNAKIIVTQRASPTKFEPQYLLANTKLLAGAGLQNFLTSWNSSEWSTVNTYYHVVDAADGDSSVVELDTGAGTLVSGSVVTSPDNQGTSTAITLPGTSNLDVKATTNSGNIFGSRIIVKARIPTIPAAPVTLLGKNSGSQVVLTWSPGDNGGLPITGYNIYRDTHSTATTLLATVGKVTTYADPTVIVGSGTQYFYRVVATNAIGDSTYSNEVSSIPQRTILSKPPNYLSAQSSGLAGYWTFDGKDTNWATGTASDKSGSGNDGRFQSLSTTTSSVAGHIGQGLSFNGSTSGVRLNSDITNWKTISLWFKLNSASQDFQGLFSQIAGGNSASRGYYGSNGTITIQIKNSAECFFGTVASGIVANKWYHFVVSLDSSQSVAYLNGAVSATTVTGNCVPDTGSDVALLGQGFAGGFFLNGVEDDVRVYSRALSAAEVGQLYRAGSAKVNKSTIGHGSGLDSGLVGYWTFDGKDTNWATGVTSDKSGSGNSGYLIKLSTTTSPIQGKIGQGLKFNSSNLSQVSASSLSSVSKNTSFSVSLWFNANTTQVGGANLLEHALAADDIFVISFNTYPDLEAGIYNGVSYTKSSGTIPSIPGWHHVVATYNGSVMTEYIDGLPASGSNNPNTQVANTGLTFGSDISSNSRNYNGSLDDVRIYNRALSATEVNKLYNFGKAKVKP